MAVTQPAWYVAQLKEVEEGKRHEYPCGGKIFERTFGYMDREDNYKAMYCYKCRKVLETSD